MAELIFSFTIEDYEAPFLASPSPLNGAKGIGRDSLISFYVVDESSGVAQSSIDAYVNGTKVFEGPNTFIYPYNGAQSSIVADSYEGYDGYKLTLNNSSYFLPSTDYTVRVVASDANGNSMDESFSFRTATGISSAQYGPYEITIDVAFGSDLYDDTELTNPANYTFSNGMYTRYVEKLTDNSIRLWIELFYGEEQFTLTVNSNVKDSYGYSIPSYWNTTTIEPFESTANIGNYNGKIRTWRESSLVSADTQRIYLAGSKGIDIFKREESVIPNRWAQIFDSYGINSMFVANFGGEYIFTDTTPPYVSEMSPFPSSTVVGTLPISFKITDATTAVEITSVTIYVNEKLAFSGGSGGWANGYSGKIEIGYQYLEFSEILPSTLYTNGEEVEVRIIASDLLDNSVDFSYSFFVGESVVSTGFGFDEFGKSSFGNV